MEGKFEKAKKANLAANAIGSAMAKTLADMRPGFVVRFNLDEQLITLAIAQASVDIAAEAAARVTGMDHAGQIELGNRLHEVVFEAMNELLTT